MCAIVILLGQSLRAGRLAAENREARITHTGNPGFYHHSIVPDLSAEATLFYALKELPQPQVVFACGFLIENPDPWTLST
jgi:hypothetical protein